MRTWIKSTLAIGTAVAVTGLVTSRVVSQQYEEMMQDMDPEMAAWIKLAAPGKEHEQLVEAAGTWNQKVTNYMGPGEPMVTRGTATIKPILGGRFIVEHVKGEPMAGADHPFEGMGIYGYDNGQQKYVYAWVDNHGTMIMTGEGTADPSGKVVTYFADLKAPDGSILVMKSVLKRTSDDEQTHDMYLRDDEGGWQQAVGIVATKKR